MKKNEFYHKEKIDAFVKYLYKLKGSKNRADLAHLRTAPADPLDDFKTISILGKVLPTQNGPTYNAYRTVAILFALQAQKYTASDMPVFASKQNRRSFGASLRRLRSQIQSGEKGLDQQFSALIDREQEDLLPILRQFVQRITNAVTHIPIDYYALLRDLLSWKLRQTRISWTRDYYQAETQQDEQT